MKNDKDSWHIWSSTCRHFFQKRFDIFVLVAVFISRYTFWLFRVPPLFRGHRHVTKWFSFDMCRMRSSAECWPGALGCWGRLNWVANRWGDFFVICYPILNESWIFGCQSKPNGSNNSNFWLIALMGATSLQGSVGFQVTEDRQTQNTMILGKFWKPEAGSPWSAWACHQAPQFFNCWWRYSNVCVQNLSNDGAWCFFS